MANGGPYSGSSSTSSGSVTTSASSTFNVYLQHSPYSGTGFNTEWGNNGIYGISHNHPLCDSIGHKLDKTLIEYYDGTAMGQCLNCMEKICYVPPPGGTTVLRLHKALAVVAEGGDFTSEWLDVFQDIHDKLREEAQAVRAAEALLDAAAAYLSAKFGAKRAGD